MVITWIMMTGVSIGRKAIRLRALKATVMRMIDLVRMRLLMSRLPRMLWDAERKMANAERITPSITGMPRGGSGNRQEDANVAYADAMDAYREAFAELEQMRKELEPLISRIEDVDVRAVMRLRYIHGYRPAEIPGVIYKSERSTYYYLTRGEHEINHMIESLQ